RDPSLRPLLERGDERVLREILGQPDVTHYPGESGDEPGGLDPVDRVDRATCIGRHRGSGDSVMRSTDMNSPATTLLALVLLLRPLRLPSLRRLGAPAL